MSTLIKTSIDKTPKTSLPIDGDTREGPKQEEGCKGKAGGQQNENLDSAVAVTQPTPEWRGQAVGTVLQPK